MIYSNDKTKCCACGACVKICPVKAISLTPDENGNYYPFINDICIGCGKCESVCNYLIPHDYYEPQSVYAVKLKNENVSNKSASGGAFVGLASSFLAKNYDSIVCGCSFTTDFFPTHVAVKQVEHLKLLQGSKYVRSDLHIFDVILDYLKQGKRVLFSGTPCQCEAVRLYCKKYEKCLYTIELICHGTIDVDYWMDYISFIQKDKDGKLVDFSFRSKEKKRNYVCRYSIQKSKNTLNNKIKTFYETEATSYYYNHFLSGQVFRENCYFCPFAKRERCADITIGDYWGYSGGLDSTDGLSAIIVNSPKGMQLFDESKNDFEYEERTFEDVARTNEQLSKPFDINKKNYQILREWKEYGSEYLNKIHHKQHWKAFLASKIGVLK